MAEPYTPVRSGCEANSGPRCGSEFESVYYPVRRNDGRLDIGVCLALAGGRGRCFAETDGVRRQLAQFGQ